MLWNCWEGLLSSQCSGNSQILPDLQQNLSSPMRALLPCAHSYKVQTFTWKAGLIMQTNAKELMHIQTRAQLSLWGRG